ncbi:uncharacterized protein LOC141498966 [Macrotis lagotis]|uniref:uncharacterized protein LOC141498966 n=1 Tax=Macrotis lagotis TaxID=92651 RepID=UPI003D681509
MSSNRKFTEYDKKKILEENSKLKCELKVLRNQYEWLIEEGKSECFDERRINLLKAQVMQLQRQVVLLTEGLSSRSTLLLELNEALNPLSEKLRSFLDCNSPTCEVPVARSELKQMIKICQSLQCKLQKTHQATGIEALALPWLMSRKNFTKPRVTLLDLCYGKMDNLNLQYVVVLLTEGLSSRSTLLLELNEALNPLSEKLRSFLDCNSPTCEVPVARSELKQMIKICQSLQCKLQKTHQATGIEALALPWLMSRKNFTKPRVTLLDLCYGKMDNLNLQYVSALETKLSQLYRHLHGMMQTLNFILAPGQGCHKQSLQILPTVVYCRLINQMKRCNQSLEQCCNDLLILTLIVPSAPWAKIQNALIPEFTVDSVLAILPSFPKGAPQEKAKKAVEALLKATNYAKLMTTQQINALQAEVSFHRSIYNLQVKYTKAVFDGIKQAYHSFLANVDGFLCSPLRNVLSAYTNLTMDPSDTAFNNFLTVLKNNAEQIQEAIDTLTPSENLQHEGDEALSRLGKEFFLSLEQSLRDCGEQRDKATREMEVLRIELEQAIRELQILRREQREKGMEPPSRFSKWKRESVVVSENMPTQLSISQFSPQKEKLVINSIFSSRAESSRNCSSWRLQEETIERAPSHHRGKNFRLKIIKSTRLSSQD